MITSAPDRRAGIVIAVSQFDRVFDFLTEDIGLRVEQIFPADAPLRCTLVGFGCRVHLEPGLPHPTTLRFEIDDPSKIEASVLQGPDGLTIEFVEAVPPLVFPPLLSTLSLTHAEDSWHIGRAGMRYRDLVPDRQGGAVIASQIRIATAGPVPDYVHFHEIAFQLIFCRRGQVTVVYEDQGEPFVLTAGDCVTQPPRIRHRVLESSDDLDVIEIGYPAEHITRSDPAMQLPTTTVNRLRLWDGQRFVHHRRAAQEPTQIADGVHQFDTGVADGTHDLADVTEVDIDSSSWLCPTAQDKEFVLLFALQGDGGVSVTGQQHATDSDFVSGSALVVPVGHTATVTARGRLSILQVRIRTL